MTDRANSATFLKAIAYDVNMAGNQIKFITLNLALLKVIKTCTYHQSMDYCPVLLQI